MLPSSVKIVEVGPRDGLQNEQQTIPLAAKLQLIEELACAGIKYIETGSFVSPKWVPQMADSLELFQQLTKQTDVIYSALTPNMQGLQAALVAKVDEVAIFAAASESFSMRNINCTIAESLLRFEPVIKHATAQGLKVRGYVSCILGCPYEGEISPEKVVQVAQQMLAMGCYEVSLGDTVGVGTPLKTAHLLNTLLQHIPVSKLAVHFHDTYGQALANILIALQHGISVIDSSVAGLGGCPYAKGAAGNVATEDVIYMLNGMGINTGIKLPDLVKAGEHIMRQLGRTSQSKVAQAMSKLTR